ncbi:flagellar hook-associated protein FlgL [bacterium]|nr:flagellar hook-associated protein FlgL [bacterium]
MYSNRISTAARYNLLASDIKKNEEAFNRLTAQLASGKKFSSITEDPIAAVNIVNTNRQLGQIETFNKNVEMAKTEIQTMDDLLDLANGYLSRAWDKAVQANNQTYNDDSLKALKVEIDEILNTVVDLANTEFNGNYVFAGANVKLPPYKFDENGNVIYTGTKQGSPYIRQYEVADGVYETINTTGDKVFGWYEGDGEGEYSGLIGTLKLLSNSIQGVVDGHAEGDNAKVQESYEKMNSTLSMFQKSLDTITAEQTKFGGVYNRLEMTNNTLETNTENLTSYLSQLQEVDIAQAVSDWYQAQYAYQASLQVASASMGMSLLNYMQ